MTHKFTNLEIDLPSGDTLEARMYRTSERPARGGVIIIPGLARKQPLTFDWGTYHPSAFEITIVVGAFGLVFFLLLLFAKVFPLIPLFDIKEGQTLADNIQVGRRSVPALRVEE